MSKPIRMPQADEQIVLEELQVELVHPEALPRFQSLLRRHHYLGGIKPVGERLYYVAAWRGQWLALLVSRGRQTFASSGEVDWLDGSAAPQAFGAGDQ